jgi:hypothetical protein
MVVLSGSKVVPSIGSMPLGTTFQVVGTAPIQYSTVCPTRSPDEGLKVKFRAVGLRPADTFAGAAPDGSTNATTAATPASITPASDSFRADRRCFTTPNLRESSLRVATGRGRHEVTRLAAASVPPRPSK